LAGDRFVDSWGQGPGDPRGREGLRSPRSGRSRRTLLRRSTAVAGGRGRLGGASSETGVRRSEAFHSRRAESPTISCPAQTLGDVSCRSGCACQGIPRLADCESGIFSARSCGSRDFRAFAMASRPLFSQFCPPHSHENSHLTSLDERLVCRVKSRHYRRPRRLGWPRTPDFQSGTGVVCRSQSVSLGHAPSQESPHRARNWRRSRPVTQCDRVGSTVTEQCHQECHETLPTPTRPSRDPAVAPRDHQGSVNMVLEVRA
jgi:hypothetical protein